MEKGKTVDPLVLGRRAHAKVFDRPIIVGKGTTEDEQVKSALHECLTQGRPEEFRKWLERERPCWKGNERAQYCMGLALKAERRYDEAKKCFETALAERRASGDPMRISLVLHQLALIAVAKGERETAWNYYDEAMSFMPGFFITHHNRLCLACHERDEKKLRAEVRLLEACIPQWFRDERLVEAMKTDGALEYLRNDTPDLWKHISSKFRGEDTQ